MHLVPSPGALGLFGSPAIEGAAGSLQKPASRTPSDPADLQEACQESLEDAVLRRANLLQLAPGQEFMRRKIARTLVVGEQERRGQGAVARIRAFIASQR